MEPGEKTDKTVFKFASSAARTWSHGLCDFAEALCSKPMRETIFIIPSRSKLSGIALVQPNKAAQPNRTSVPLCQNFYSWLWRVHRHLEADELPLKKWF